MGAGIDRVILYVLYDLEGHLRPREDMKGMYTVQAGTQVAPLHFSARSSRWTEHVTTQGLLTKISQGLHFGSADRRGTAPEHETLKQ